MCVRMDQSGTRGEYFCPYQAAPSSLAREVGDTLFSKDCISPVRTETKKMSCRSRVEQSRLDQCRVEWSCLAGERPGPGAAS